MDAPRFAAFTRALGTSRNRRGALAALAGGGILAAFGKGRSPAVAQSGPCALAVVATIREGPSLGPGDNPPPQELRGTACLALMPDSATGANGSEQDVASAAGTLRLADGTTFPVIGAAPDHWGRHRVVGRS